MMLMEVSDKERIRAEEIFRQEVRRDLAAQAPRSLAARLWAVLNSAFGMWFLSTVAVGSIVWVYQTRAEQRTRHDAASMEQRRIILELMIRISALDSHLQHHKKLDWTTAEKDEEARKATGAYLDEDTAFAFPELRACPLAGLLFRLSSLASTATKREQIKRVADSWLALRCRIVDQSATLQQIEELTATVRKLTEDSSPDTQ